MSSEEFNAIGLVKKNMKLSELVEQAGELHIQPGLLAMLYEKMFKITEKFLEIEKRLAEVEKEYPVKARRGT